VGCFSDLAIIVSLHELFDMQSAVQKSDDMTSKQNKQEESRRVRVVLETVMTFKKSLGFVLELNKW